MCTQELFMDRQPAGRQTKLNWYSTSRAKNEYPIICTYNFIPFLKERWNDGGRTDRQTNQTL